MVCNRVRGWTSRQSNDDGKKKLYIRKPLLSVYSIVKNLLLIFQVGYCHSKLLVHTTYNESDRSNK